MQKRTVIITGANSGIGKAAAFKFAENGHRVIMACRSMELGEQVKHEVIIATGNHEVELLKLDVSSFESIRRFCMEVEDRYSCLDIIIHNAAYFNHGLKEYQLSSDRLELTFATNVFGPFYLTHLLKGLLAKSDDPRILNACSTNIKHFFDPKRAIAFDSLQGHYKASEPYTVYKMYGDSKMGLLLLTLRMAEVFRSEGINVNALLIPGTRLSKETLRKLSWSYRLAGMLMNPFWPEPAVVAENYYHICTSDEFRTITGQLVNNRNQVIPPSAEGEKLSPAKQLWRMTRLPAYASNRDHSNSMWNLCREVVEDYQTK